MPDEPDNEIEVSDNESDDQDDLEDTEDTEDSDEDSTDDEDLSDDSEEDGDEEDEDDEPAPNASVAAPTGRALLDALSSDPEAQSLIATSLEQIMRERANSAAAEEEAREFQKLVDAGDYATIGERIVERTQLANARRAVEEEYAKSLFGPVYQDIARQPEMKNLTAEEREAIDPNKFESDAHYVRFLEGFVQTKRFNAQVEAEVEKRIAARDEAAKNGKVADVTKQKSLAGRAPPATGPVLDRKSSTDLLRQGLRDTFDPRAIDDDDN